MSILLSDGTTTVTLHPDLYWSDENNWHPVVQTASHTIPGDLIAQTGVRGAGRAITLEPEDDSSAWMHHTVVAQLRNWAAVPGKTLTLTLRGVARTVIFRHQDGGFEAVPIVHYRDVVDNDWYRCTVRLTEI